MYPLYRTNAVPRPSDQPDRFSRPSAVGIRRTLQACHPTHSGNKSVDLTIGLRPDFWARRFDMCTTIGHVIKLVCPNCAIGLGFANSLAKRSEYRT